MQQGHKTGSTNKEGHDEKKPWLVSPEPDPTPTASRGFSQVTEIQSSFLKIIITLLCLFSSYFKGRSAWLPVDQLTKYTHFLVHSLFMICNRSSTD